MRYFKKACAIPVIFSTETPLYVLVKSTNGNWVFPKGSIKKKESCFQAAKREALEEAGCATFPHMHRGGLAEPVGSYTYKLNGKRKPTLVFAIFPYTMLETYLECETRERRVCTYKEARQLLGRRSVRRILKSLNKQLTKEK
jgi:8-oxo-dGTP pyrophosphatase MutT (NUDIX family)